MSRAPANVSAGWFLSCFLLPARPLTLVCPAPSLPLAGSAITGPVAKECADLWPRVAAAANTIV